MPLEKAIKLGKGEEGKREADNDTLSPSGSMYEGS